MDEINGVKFLEILNPYGGTFLFLEKADLWDKIVI